MEHRLSVRVLPAGERFISLTLAYNQQDYIEDCLRSLAPSCDAMIVMHSEVPFTRYNPNARRESFIPDATGSILSRLEREFHHLLVIHGDWASEEDMRNAGLVNARRLAARYLLIVDADEFYNSGDLLKAQLHIASHPGYDSWWCRMRVPFKYHNYVVNRENEYLPVALNLAGRATFTNRRIPDGTRLGLPPEISCFNMGFVLPDERMFEKTRTWSHFRELPPLWYLEKWLGWTPSTRNLHTRVPELWPSTRLFNPRDLPEVLRSHSLATTPESGL
jgi:hypothetical protein